MENTTTLVQQVMAMTGAQTEQEAIHQVLQEYIQRSTQKEILSYIGSKVWEGNLESMRECK